MVTVDQAHQVTVVIQASVVILAFQDTPVSQVILDSPVNLDSQVNLDFLVILV